MGLSTIPILWELMAAIFKLDFKVINFLNRLIFATQRISKRIRGVNADIKSNKFPN